MKYVNFVKEYMLFIVHCSVIFGVSGGLSDSGKLFWLPGYLSDNNKEIFCASFC